MSYIIPGTLEEALRALEEGAGEARVIAGGTDLFPVKPLPPDVVDITALPESGEAGLAGGRLRLGSCVTHAAAAASPLVREKAAALALACGMVGSPQVRNLGTLGGNVVNAAPAADAAVALVALGAEALLVERGGRRREPVERLYAGYNRSRVDATRQILLYLELPAGREGEGSSFQRFAARRSLSLPLFSAAAWLRLEKGRIEALRLVAAPLEPAPTRLRRTEERLRGLPAAEQTWTEAGEWARKEVSPRSSPLRCSGTYRRELARVLVARALREAALRADYRGEGGTKKHA